MKPAPPVINIFFTFYFFTIGEISKNQLVSNISELALME